MNWSEHVEFHEKMQNEVYNDVLDDLLWHMNYHDKKTREFTNNDSILFAYHYDKYRSYKTLVEHFKHFKF